MFASKNVGWKNQLEQKIAAEGGGEPAEAGPTEEELAAKKAAEQAEHEAKMHIVPLEDELQGKA